MKKAFLTIPLFFLLWNMSYSKSNSFMVLCEGGELFFVNIDTKQPILISSEFLGRDSIFDAVYESNINTTSTIYFTTESGKFGKLEPFSSNPQPISIQHDGYAFGIIYDKLNRGPVTLEKLSESMIKSSKKDIRVLKIRKSGNDTTETMENYALVTHGKKNKYIPSTEDLIFVYTNIDQKAISDGELSTEGLILKYPSLRTQLREFRDSTWYLIGQSDTFSLYTRFIGGKITPIGQQSRSTIIIINRTNGESQVFKLNEKASDYYVCNEAIMFAGKIAFGGKSEYTASGNIYFYFPNAKKIIEGSLDDRSLVRLGIINDKAFFVSNKNSGDFRKRNDESIIYCMPISPAGCGKLEEFVRIHAMPRKIFEVKF